MKTSMRFFIFIMIIAMPFTVFAEFTPTNQPRSYILIDYDTGTVLTEFNSNESCPIASVTKVMTMLITMESIQSGKISMNDMVTASEYACSMGGSQIYLEPGEQMSVEELLKSVAVGSATSAVGSAFAVDLRERRVRVFLTSVLAMFSSKSTSSMNAISASSDARRPSLMMRV